MDWIHALLPALAMALGWGIRGQFGGETGAMVPGALVGLALGLAAGYDAAGTVRLGAIGALACSVGGMMTYGQTLGLIHDSWPPSNFGWGLLGLAVKGGVWIGLTGAFLGMAGSRCSYRPSEILLLGLGLTLLALLGIRLLNRPLDPPHSFPPIYFSKPFDAKPRSEVWAGLWFALLGLLAYLHFVRGDRAAVGLALGGLLGGAVGFPLGELLQAWGIHSQPFGPAAQRWIDWWKVMEVTFGGVAGLALGLGWYWMRAESTAASPEWKGGLEALSMALWMAWLVASLAPWKPAMILWHLPFLGIVLPLAGVFTGSLWPAFVVLPLLTLVSGADVSEYWMHEKGQLAPLYGCLGLLILTGMAGGLAWRWVTAGARPEVWFVGTVWLQTGLTWLKFGPEFLRLPSAEALARQGRLAWLHHGGSGLVVEIGFLALAAVLTWLAGRSGR